MAVTRKEKDKNEKKMKKRKNKQTTTTKSNKVDAVSGRFVTSFLSSTIIFV